MPYIISFGRRAASPRGRAGWPLCHTAVVNTALQATRNGVPVLRNTPEAMALALRQTASTLPVAGMLTLGDLLPTGKGNEP